MSTEDQGYEVAEEEIPEDSPDSNKCRFCPETFANGQLRYNHERTHHTDEFKKESPDGKRRLPAVGNPIRPRPARDNPPRDNPVDNSGGGKPVTISGVRMDSVHEMTRRFAEALDNTAGDMNGGKKKQIILAFDDIAFQITQDPSRLAQFLNKCGVSLSQGEYIKLVLLGLDSEPQSQWGQTGAFPGQPGNGMQAMTFDPQSGRMVPAPIFMIGGQNSPQAQQQAPYFVMPPYNQGRQDESLSRRDVRDIVEEVVEKLKPAAAPEPTSNTQVRKYQQPTLGADGEVLVDPSSGHPIMAWVEEPVDPLNDILGKLQAFGVVGKPEIPQPASAEEIGKSVATQIQPLLPEKQSQGSTEVQELAKVFQDYIHKSELKEAERNGAKEALDAHETTMKPYLEELRDLRSRTGLSDHQADLQHQELTQKGILGTLSASINGLRSDLQPLAMQTTVANMKAMGLSDNTIGEFIRRMPNPNTPARSGADDDKRAAVMAEWAAE